MGPNWTKKPKIIHIHKVISFGNHVQTNKTRCFREIRQLSKLKALLHKQFLSNFNKIYINL